MTVTSGGFPLVPKPASLKRVRHGFPIDGEVLYCGSVSPEAATLLRIDMEGQVQVLWRQKGATATWGVPSPDGRHLAVLGAIINSNQWMVEGF